MNQNILYEKKEELSKKSQDEIIEILEKQGAKDIKIDFVRSNIIIESTDEELLSKIIPPSKDGGF